MRVSKTQDDESYYWDQDLSLENLVKPHAPTAMRVWSGHLYLGLRDFDGGAKLLRSRDGSQWESITSSGFGDKNNGDIYGLANFNGRIYCGTYNGVFQGHGMSLPSSGGQIWRSENGIDWELVVKGGLGNINNQDMWSFMEFHDHLYVGTWNPDSGGQIWRSIDGKTFSQAFTTDSPDQSYIRSFAVNDNKIYASTGKSSLVIYESTDGLYWRDISSGVLPDYLTCGTQITSVCGTLVIGSTKWRTGPVEIWTYSDQHWKLIARVSQQLPTASLISSMTPYGERGVIITVWDDICGVTLYFCEDIEDARWIQINESGFGDNIHSGGRTEIFRNNIFVCTCTSAVNRKSRIWRGTKLKG